MLESLKRKITLLEHDLEEKEAALDNVSVILYKDFIDNKIEYLFLIYIFELNN